MQPIRYNTDCNQLTLEEECQYLAKEFEGNTEPYITLEEFLEFVDNPQILGRINMEIIKGDVYA
jgi:hypothetical protein